MKIPREVSKGSPGAKTRYIAAYNKAFARHDESKANSIALREVEKDYYLGSKKKVYLPKKTLEPLKSRYESVDELPLDVKGLPLNNHKVMWMIQYNNAIHDGKKKGIAKDIAWNAVKRFASFIPTTCKWVTKKEKSGLSVAFQKALAQRLLKKRNNKEGKEGEENVDSMIVKCDERFEFFVPLKKGENGKLLIEDEGGIAKSIGELADDKKYYIWGEATNTKVDKEKDQVVQAFLQKMRDTILGITVYKEHKRDIDHAIGVTDKEGGDSDSLSARTYLLHPNKNDVVKDIVIKMDHGIPMGYSIGGRLTKVEFVFNEDEKVEVRKLLDGTLDELSITTRPAGAVTFAQAIAKSLDCIHSPLGELLTKAKKDGIETILESVLRKKTSPRLQALVKLYKSLDTISELEQFEEIADKMREAHWHFSDLINQFVRDDEMTPKEKKKKIKDVSEEYVAIIESSINELISSALLMGDE